MLPPLFLAGLLPAAPAVDPVAPPPEAREQFTPDPMYTRQVEALGIPVVSSAPISAAASRLRQMPDGFDPAQAPAFAGPAEWRNPPDEAA